MNDISGVDKFIINELIIHKADFPLMIEGVQTFWSIIRHLMRDVSMLSMELELGDNSAKYSWSTKEKYFEVEFFESGLLEYFISAPDGETRFINGTEDPIPLAGCVEKLVAYLMKYFLS